MRRQFQIENQTANHPDHHTADTLALDPNTVQSTTNADGVVTFKGSFYDMYYVEVRAENPRFENLMKKLNVFSKIEDALNDPQRKDSRRIESISEEYSVERAYNRGK